MRTNFFQLGADGQPRPTIAVKFESRKIEGLPLPRPLYEIFVYSPRVEGVHLRFGKVARGGMRWSDRPQDFRTEVLGLVKAQQVKNAVIVPVGAKGGFVPKHLPPPQTRGRAWPRASPPTSIFIAHAARPHRQSSTAPPSCRRPTRRAPRRRRSLSRGRGRQGHGDLLRHRQRLSPEHGFWLGDAFASGGSAGYDHKKMGITARGAWEAVSATSARSTSTSRRRPSRVAGVGDMSGDVFGNGMLLSRAHPAGRGVRPPRHLPRSRPRPGGAPWPSASACSSCRARAGRITTRRCSRRAAASSRAALKRSRSRPKRARCSASRRRRLRRRR